MVMSSAYSPLDSLVDLACRDGVDVRPTLLRVITDLYVQKPAHTAEEETQYVELALGLIGAVDEATRAAVAARLGGYANAPLAVLERLGAAPAALPSAPPLIPALAPEPEMAAAPAPSSPDLPNHDLVELFFSASAEERRLILINLDVMAEPVLQPPLAPEAVIRRLESTALQRNVTEFALMLERGLSVSRELAFRITHDRSGEGIVVAAKMLGMKADVLQRVLLFLNPAIGQSVARVFELAQLYDDIPWHTAAFMVAIWRQKSDRLRPRHASVHWNDERSSARARATPSHHLGARNEEPHPRQGTGTKPTR